MIAVITLATALNSCQSPSPPLANVFHYNQHGGLKSLDPAFARDQASIWACNQLYNGVVQLDSQLHIVPAIASSWEISNDGKTYTFHLRNDVRFHHDPCFKGSTRTVTATDVVYSWNRILQTKTASPGSWIFNGRLDSIQPFATPDSLTVVVHLARPFPPMLGIFTMPYCNVVPHEAIEYYGADFRSHPVGTGPFQFKTWKEGVALVLVKNPHYFETDENGNPLPKIDGVRVSFINSKKAEFLSFKKGELDFVSGLDAAYIDEVLDDRGELVPALRNAFRLTKAPYLNTEYYGFNLAMASPWKDKKLRQAVNFAINRRELLQYIRKGIGTPAEQGFTPPGLPSFDASIKGYNYQPQRAMELLAAAGFPNGKGLQELSLYTNETYKEMALSVCKQLEKIGLNVRVEINQDALLREWMTGGKTPFFRGSWIADYPDAESYFTVFYGKNGAPPNYTRFHNQRYDSIYEQALQVSNDSVRYELYHQLENIIIDEAPVIPLYYDVVLRFTSNRVHGLPVNGLNLLDVKRVTLNETP